MKKSEMILSIASDIVINKPHINFKEAQELAEIALLSMEEKSELQKALDNFLNASGWDDEEK
jgi:hypothetical protein